MCLLSLGLGLLPGLELGDDVDGQQLLEQPVRLPLLVVQVVHLDSGGREDSDDTVRALTSRVPLFIHF